jgi:hypothetical protein
LLDSPKLFDALISSLSKGFLGVKTPLLRPVNQLK